MAMAETAFRSDETFSQAEFRRWLDDRPRGDINRYELINGRIVMTPPAGWPHGQIELTLGRLFGEYVSRLKLGLVQGSSAGYNLPSGDTIEPDLSFISAERFAAGPKPAPGEFLRIVPNLVVEILSRSTARRDRTEKKEVYARNGVEEYWLVDPDRKSVTVYHLGRRGYGAGKAFTRGRVRSRVLPRLNVSAAEIFAL
jgi:Uma2 family endonuclease